MSQCFDKVVIVIFSSLQKPLGVRYTIEVSIYVILSCLVITLKFIIRKDSLAAVCRLIHTGSFKDTYSDICVPL